MLVMLKWLCVTSLLLQPLGTVRLDAADPETLFPSSVTSFLPDAIFDFRAARRGHRGPLTFLDRFKWASRIWRQLSPRQRNRLIRNSQLMKVSSFYSGLGGLEWLVFFIWREGETFKDLSRV